MEEEINFICHSVGLPVEEIEKMAEGNPLLEDAVKGLAFWVFLLWVTYNEENIPGYLAKTVYDTLQREGKYVSGHERRCEDLKRGRWP